MNYLLRALVLVAFVFAVRMVLKPGGCCAPPRTMESTGSQNGRVEQLRRSLMSKAMGDSSKAASWVDYERSKAPWLSEEEYYAPANERWERDNR